jgi:Zn-dependent protease
LEDLTRKAQIAFNGGDLATARQFWANLLQLLPAETVQYKSIQARVSDLDVQLAASGHGQPFWKRGAAGLGPVAFLLWKFKALLFGLTKIGTLLSMFAYFGVYWALYGWAFAAGLVISIYIHEMGHVIELRKFGIPAGAPMFIPGLGAIIQLRGVSLAPVQDSRVGLAGPIYGLGAAIVAAAFYWATGAKIWAVIANFGAVINLFNLIPIWQLDGARGFHSLTRNQRWIILVLTLVLWRISSEGMLFLIVLGAAYRLFKRDANAEPDNTGFVYFVFLLLALTAIAVLLPRK